jgi:dCMP deaminase
MNKWDDRFIKLAQHVSEWSKDPSTKVGAVVVDDDHIVFGIGYNGFPRGVTDSESRLQNRDIKYSYVVHSEANAILNSTAPLEGCTIYTWPLFPCNECAKLIVQSGIKRVVGPDPLINHIRWKDSNSVALQMFKEAGVKFRFYRQEDYKGE